MSKDAKDEKQPQAAPPPKQATGWIVVGGCVYSVNGMRVTSAVGDAIPAGALPSDVAAELRAKGLIKPASEG